ncbi:MAG: SDR family NAD(P)-dependent oxidoreductase, partial [Parvibaculaceae bacterium]|nr:SDR family NAD(P)-dependent oxidoreductase [Parvibaculaceae bacterium]
MTTLEGKTAIITGASSGIGYETAKLFAAHGANLILNGRQDGILKTLAAEIGEHHNQPIAVASDITDEKAAQHLVEVALNQFGSLDIAFNNAGIMGQTGPITEMSVDDWRTTLDTNLTSAFLNAKHQIPALLQSPTGSLIFTSSFVGHTIGMPGMAAYGASKAGLIGLTKNLAAEYGPNGLRVNALLPGGTDTPMSITN